MRSLDLSRWTVVPAMCAKAVDDRRFAYEDFLVRGIRSGLAACSASHAVSRISLMYHTLPWGHSSRELERALLSFVCSTADPSPLKRPRSARRSQAFLMRSQARAGVVGL